MNSIIIKTENLSKDFGEKKVLNNISIEVKEGESFVVIGKSGVGKSVLIKCILGILQADKGRVFLNNIDVSNISKEKRVLMNKDIGMLFQGSALFDSLNIFENVIFGLKVHGERDKKKLKDIAVKNLEIVGLDSNILESFPAELSGGMQKRVAMARLISTNPKILFFDEPTTGLDPIMSEVINDVIMKANKYLGSTSFTITHDMKSAKKIGDTLAMIDKGEIVWQGKVQDIDSCNNKAVINFLNGTY